MHNLGQTRSSQQSNHLLVTADTFVRNTLPGMKKCSAIVHAGPAMGARFTQYTAEFEAGGELGNATAQRFIFVMDGGINLEIGDKRTPTGNARLRLFARRLAASRRSPRKRVGSPSSKNPTSRCPRSNRPA